MMPSVFETDHRLRDLMQLEPIVRHAGTLARTEGNDTEALIVAILVLSDAKQALIAELAKWHKHTMPPIYMDATPELIEQLKTLGVLKPKEGEADE